MTDRVRLPVTAVRRARAADLDALAPIEAAADAVLATVMDIGHWPPPDSGQTRAGQPGWVLVVGDPVVGFAHLRDLGDGAHLEQLAVHPAAHRQGLETMLLWAAFGVALDAGYDRLTVMTYADVSWNGPWYTRRGFTELTPADDPQSWARLAPMRAAEERLKLARGGRRVAMVRDLIDDPAPIPAVSVIPVRDGAGGLEVFVQHRATTMDFVPGAIVFPGGRVDPVDRDVARQRLASAGPVPGDDSRWADTAYGRLAPTADEAALVLRQTGVRELAEECGVVVAARSLLPWDNWVTPIGGPKRFDVFFFVLPVEDGSEFGHTTTEATGSEWMPVDEIVRGCRAGDLMLVPPTRALVDELQALGSLAAVTALRPAVRSIRHDLLPTSRPRRPGATA